MGYAPPLDELLTTAQAARVLGVSDVYVRSLLRSKRLPSISTPLGRLIRPSDVECLAQTRASRQAVDSGANHG